jgi:hypothetical protein
VRFGRGAVGVYGADRGDVVHLGAEEDVVEGSPKHEVRMTKQIRSNDEGANAVIDENPYEAPQTPIGAGTTASSAGDRAENGFDAFRFLVSMVFTIGATLTLFGLVVFVGYILVGTEWGREFPVVLSAFCGTGFCIALVMSRITAPEALEKARRTNERVLLAFGFVFGLTYWLFEALK